MPSKLPVLPLLCILTHGAAQFASAQQTDPPTAADPAALMVRAVNALEKCNTISAKIVHEVHLYDKHLLGSGIYLGRWRDRDYLMRLELKIQIGQETSSLVQVCDGRFLWTRHKLPADDKLTRVDLVRANAALEKAKKNAKPGGMGLLPGIGGLPKVFRGLHRAWEFDTATRGSWGQLKQPVWRIRGRWKPGALVRIFPDKEAAIRSSSSYERIPEASRLPPHLPDQVVVFLLAQEDPFPFRIEYRRSGPEDTGPDGVAGRALVTMELSDVDINSPIADERFIYNPGDVEPADVTEDFLRELRIAWQ